MKCLHHTPTRFARAAVRMLKTEYDSPGGVRRVAFTIHGARRRELMTDAAYFWEPEGRCKSNRCMCRIKHSNEIPLGHA